MHIALLHAHDFDIYQSHVCMFLSFFDYQNFMERLFNTCTKNQKKNKEIQQLKCRFSLKLRFGLNCPLSVTHQKEVTDTVSVKIKVRSKRNCVSG